jgi:Leu/Phe-tRNA-protein transferase
MDNYTATGIAEGFIEAESEEQVIEAWQHLHDTGLAYSLQGWFGRQARSLLAAGIIK